MHDSDPTPRQDPEDRDRPGGPEGPDKQTGAGRADGGGPQPDIDAEFAAMMEGLSLPDEMQADLESLDETEPSVISVDDVPHNTYTAPREPLTGARGPDREQDATGREPDDPDDPDGLTPEQAAEADSLAAALNAEAPRTPQAVKVAVVLTPLASAEALASLCAMSDLECTVVPSRSGAFAVKEFVSAHAEWDVSELLGGADTEPAEAAELASALSRLSRAGVVLMTADLATDVGIESGLSGTITARRYTDGEAGEDAAAGLLLASMDQEVEDVLLGVTRAEDIKGAVRSSEVRPGRAMRWFGRGLRRPRGGKS